MKREKNSHELYWNDLNQIKFLGLLTASSLILRTCFHPLALIKTRLQTEEKNSKSPLKMFKQISLNERFPRAFYRGYSVSLCALLFDPIFLGTLEITRTILKTNRPNSISTSQWDNLTSSLSAATASIIQQTFIVPLDVITQRLMITRLSDDIKIRDIVNNIYYKSGDGIQGFYKGYLITLGISLPFNSILWTLYWKIQFQLEKIIPIQYDEIISPLSSTIASFSTSLITQPIDVLKTRLQVSTKKQSILKTFFILIEKRGFKGLFSGALTRSCIIVPNSIIGMSLYEFVKRASVKN